MMIQRELNGLWDYYHKVAYVMSISKVILLKAINRMEVQVYNEKRNIWDDFTHYLISLFFNFNG